MDDSPDRLDASVTKLLSDLRSSSPVDSQRLIGQIDELVRARLEAASPEALTGPRAAAGVAEAAEAARASVLETLFESLRRVEAARALPDVEREDAGFMADDDEASESLPGQNMAEEEALGKVAREGAPPLPAPQQDFSWFDELNGPIGASPWEAIPAAVGKLRSGPSAADKLAALKELEEVRAKDDAAGVFALSLELAP